MAAFPRPGTLIVPDWHQTADGRDYLSSILRRKKRKVFGLLERPVLPPQLPADIASYKIFVCGKSGVGKSSLIAGLAGLEIPTMHHETTGIQTTRVYWPVRPTDSARPIIFRFQFWDCGEAALRKFDHILPACKENADAVLFLFSFTDRSSFEDVPALISRTLGEDEDVARVVIGTKYPAAYNHRKTQIHKRGAHLRMTPHNGAPCGTEPSHATEKNTGLKPPKGRPEPKFQAKENQQPADNQSHHNRLLSRNAH